MLEETRLSRAFEQKQLPMAAECPASARLVLDQKYLAEVGMTNSVANIVERLRKAGYDINPVNNSNLWQVTGRGHMSTGQLIDLSTKVAARP